MNESRSRRHGWLLLCVLALFVATGGVYLLAQAATDAAESADDAAAVSQAKGLSRAFRSAASKVLPTVVKIHTKTKPRVVGGSRSGRGGENPFRGTPFEDFFDDDRMPGFPQHPRIPQREGIGSGVIISSEGIILTNNHVVDGADEITIELADGRKFKATDVKTDELSDLAVVRIDAKEKLPAARLGDSDTAGIGDWVLAIGSPFELDLTVSAGIISGKGRQLPSGKRTEFLQTDASINPGNSGGPLVNMDGEVIGINTAIASNNGAFQGVGFTIPINLAKWVTKQLISTGKVQRAYLGVQMGELDEALARKLGARASQGVFINEVIPDSPAAEAGLEEGDVIVAFAGHRVTGFRDLQETVERSAIGSKQQIDIIRNGKPKSLQVAVKTLPDDLGVTTVRPRNGGSGNKAGSFESDELGLKLGNLTDELARRLGYADSAGVLITEVDPEGLAAGADIREGSLIIRVGKTKVAAVADFKAAIKGEDLAEGILLVVRTPAGNEWIVLQRE